MVKPKKIPMLLMAFLALAILLLAPDSAFAHGQGAEPSRMAGRLSWAFVVFGAAVIAVIFMILFGKNRAGDGASSAGNFAQLSGFHGYLAKMRLFSYNARLYMLHVVGMDVIHGTWMVVFNLYLLAIGFDVTFIGLRILLLSLTRAIFSIPAGLISDRFGRKLSFILGDGGGAAMALVAISTTNPALILLTGALSGAFGALHGVAEPAFMAENSRNYERVHLFSVSDGTRVAASIIGSALAGLVPLLFASSDSAANIGLYRLVAYAGIVGWFASLIPALLLQQVAAPSAPAAGWRALFAGVKHRGRIWRLTVPEVLVATGAGFALPLLNIFFKENLGSTDVEIGATFAAGEALLVAGAFLAPIVAARLGKVRSVVVTRSAALPFILLMAFSREIGLVFGSIFAIAGLAYVGRIALANMASPVRSAFAMELLDPAERGTQVGIEMALSSALAGLAGYLGAHLMHRGDYRTPFLLMAACLLLSNLFFWWFFARSEGQQVGTRPAPQSTANVLIE